MVVRVIGVNRVNRVNRVWLIGIIRVNRGVIRVNTVALLNFIMSRHTTAASIDH